VYYPCIGSFLLLYWTCGIVDKHFDEFSKIFKSFGMKTDDKRV
jgi:hypothetical protein